MGDLIAPTVHSESVAFAELKAVVLTHAVNAGEKKVCGSESLPDSGMAAISILLSHLTPRS